MAIDYAKVYQNFIDEELAASSVTEWMSAHTGQVRLQGGKTVEISDLSTTGLGSYDKSKTDGSAYPDGAVTSAWKSYELSMDRGVRFSLDRADPSDSGFVATAENVIREFTRTQLTREQDTYRLNKLYKLAAAGALASKHVKELDITKQNAISELCELVQTVQDSSEQLDGYVAFINNQLKNSFLQAATGTYNTISFEQSVEINGVRYDGAMMVNDIPCIFVPGARMQTEIVARSGRESEEQGGIAPSAASKELAFIVVACQAPLAVSKIDSLKQFSPQDNQLFDGTSIQARYVYDLFVPQNKVCTIGAVVLP